VTLDRDALADWALGVALPVVPWVITAWVAARVTGFGADSAISFAQAARYLDLGEFPTRGLMNSHEFWNPNGLVLFTSALIALSRNPLVFTVLLSTVQALAVLACYRSLTANGPRRWLTYLLGLPAFLWAPILSHTGVGLWGQYVGRTFLCVLLTLALSTGWRCSSLRDAALGFMIVFAPAVHLGLLSAAPIALLPLLVPSRRARVRRGWLLAGGASALALSWLPWVTSGSAASLSGAHTADLQATRYWAAVPGPVIDSPWLLTTPYEGWLHAARAGILSLDTDACLQAFADGRCLFASLVLLAAGLLLLGGQRTGAVAIEMLAYTLLLLYLWEANGSSLEQRPDFGAMVLQPLYLGLAAGAYRMLGGLEDGLRGSRQVRLVLLMQAVLLAAVAWQVALWWKGVAAIARDVRRNVTFTLADIPLEEKTEALAVLDSDAGGRARVTVAYRNPEFHTIFPYVFFYGQRESPPARDYRPGAFFEAVLNARSRTRYAFLDGSERTDYILAHPPDSAGAREKDCTRIWAGRRLGLWRCSDEP